VLLGKLLVTPANLLLLDEPTHHLDMDACDALLSAIDNFPGTVIIVTHNEMFLHALSERLIVFETDTPRVFEGSYQRFLEKGGWQEENKGQVPDQSQPVSVMSRNKLTKKKLRRRRSEILNSRAKAIKPIEKRIKRIEEKIESQEKTLRNLNEDMQKAAQSQDGDRIPEISQSLHHCQAAIEHHFKILGSLTDSLEKQHRIFEKKLSDIEQTDDFKFADTSNF
jgi:ATP-binding cassette subfamily F protein 3